MAEDLASRLQRLHRISAQEGKQVCRTVIEDMFGRLKDWRRVATRYDGYPQAFLAAISLAATVIFWL